MTNTYKTLNPLGSNNARDLSDNASNFDEYINSDLPSIKDRFDKRRETLAGNQVAFDDAQEGRAQEFTDAQSGRESEFNADQSERDTAFQTFLDGTGWSSLGAYGAGVVISSHTQTVDYLGQPYSLKPSIPASLDAPYITTGAWATEGVNFKLVGDNSLRQDIATPGTQSLGAAIIGRGVVSVDGIKLLLSQLQRSDLRFQVRGYHAASLIGGGTFYWDATRARTAHNGGTVISPTVPWTGATSTLAAFLAGTGETAPAASGCFVRTKTPYSVDCFGAVGGSFDDTASFSACEKSGYPVLLTAPSYTVNKLTSTTAVPFELSSTVFSKLNVLTGLDIRNKTLLTMKGVDYDFTSQPSTETQGIFLQSCNELDISSNRMQHPWKSAIAMWDCVGGQVYRNRIFATGRGQQYNGIVPLGCGVIAYGCSDMTIDHNWLKDIWQIPIFANGNTGHETFDLVITNNMCRTNNDNGIRIQPDDAAHVTVRDILLQGNIINGTSRADCLRVSGLRISTIGNKVNGAGSTGIDAQYTQDSIIADNLIRDCAEGIALTSFEVVTDNVAILNNQITDCTGGTAAITVTNDSATGGSFRSIRIAGNKITKKPGVTGTTRGIAVSIVASTGMESVVVENNDINGYGAFGITCERLAVVIIQGNSVGGVRTSATAAINVQDCGTVVVGGNKDKGVETTPATSSVRLGGVNNVVSLVGNIMPSAGTGFAKPGTATTLYRNGNHFVGGTPAAYSFSGTGLGELRALATTATTAQIVNFLYTLLDDIGNDRYAHR